MLETHDPGCTEGNPCNQCKARAYLLSELGPKRYEQFSAIVEGRVIPDEDVEKLAHLTQQSTIFDFLLALGLHRRSGPSKAMERLGVCIVEDLANITTKELLNTPNVSRATFNRLVKGLGILGLKLKEE